MKTIPNQRRARSCLQAWHLAGVAPTLVAALAFPGTAKAAIDRTAVQQRAEPSGPACSAVRLEDLEALTELGCVPSIPSATTSEAAAFVSSEPLTPALQPPSDAADAVARCAIWTTVPDLDADVAVPSYCNAPPQSVLAAASVAAPVVQPAMQAAEQPGFDDSALAGGFYAVDDFYAQPPLEGAEQVAVTNRIETPVRGTIVSHKEALSEPRRASDSESSSRPNRLSDLEAPRSTEGLSSAESLSGLDAADSTEIADSMAAAGSAETLRSAKAPGSTDLASSTDSPVDLEGHKSTAGTSGSYSAFGPYSIASTSSVHGTHRAIGGIRSIVSIGDGATATIVNTIVAPSRATGRVALDSDNPQVELAVHGTATAADQPAAQRAQHTAAEPVATSTSETTAQSATHSVAPGARREAPPAMHAAAPAVRAADAHDDVKAAVNVSYTASSVPVASAAEASAAPRPTLEPQAGIGCAAEPDAELDSAMPTYCVAAAQTVVAARAFSSASSRPDEVHPVGQQAQELAVNSEKSPVSKQVCAAVLEDLADSAMPSYCIAPEQTILADRSEASNVQVLASRVNPTTDSTTETGALPEGLLGAKMVASEQLSETRGGFETTDRGQTLRISFGIERAVFVNGALVSTSTLALDGLARMTNVGAGAQGANVRAVSSTANVVHNGADNVLSIAPQNLPAGALVLQNSLSNQRLDANTVVNAVVEASGLLRATRLEAAMREATTGALRR